MNILFAAALLFALIVYIRQESRPARRTPKKPERDDLAWIDELELLDAATDDFV